MDIRLPVKYQPMDVDTDSPRYYGYEAIDGSWFIVKESSSGNVQSFRYARGNVNYSTNWTNRASLSYGGIS